MRWALIRKTWLIDKIIVAVLITVILLTTNAVLSPVNAASLSSSYQILKNNSVNQLFIERIIAHGATEAQIESFLNDLDSEVSKAGTITEANFDSIMYQSLREVITWRKNRAVFQALLEGFNDEIDYTLANHELHPNLMPLRNAVKDCVLGVTATPAVVETPEEELQDAISQEIDRQLAMQGSVVKLNFNPITGKILIPQATLQKIILSGRVLQISNINVTMSIPVSSLPSGINAIQEITVLNLNNSESAAAVQKRSANLVVLGKVYEINSIPAVQWTKPIKISISFAGADLSSIDTDEIGVYYFNESTEEWEEMDSVLDIDARKISFDTNHFSKYTVMAEKTSSVVVTPPVMPNPIPVIPAVKFADISGHWAQSIIEKMAGLEMVSGMSATQFAPERTVTRAEFATLLTKALDIKPAVQLIGRFNDVPTDKWYFTTVNTAASAGLISGYSYSRFGPDDPVSREQMAVMITKALAYKGQSSNLSEADTTSMLTGLSDKNSISPWARSGVALMMQQAIMKGRGNAEFAPRANATRAEATVLIHQMAQHLKIIK